MSALTELYEKIAVCPDCDLCRTRTRTVGRESVPTYLFDPDSDRIDRSRSTTRQ